MDLQLGLAISRMSVSSGDVEYLNGESEIQGQLTFLPSNNKRSFDESFDVDQTLHTLPLLLWNDLPHQGNGLILDDQDYSETSCVAFNRVGSDDLYDVVGWPPISCMRKKICKETNGRRRSNSLFVKVKMEGVGIARKVDLSLHHSLEMLLQTLLPMFGKCEGCVHSYKLLFKDKQGFWHLAEDVAWGSLIKSVDRLQLWRKDY